MRTKLTVPGRNVVVDPSINKQENNKNITLSNKIKMHDTFKQNLPNINEQANTTSNSKRLSTA
eukprot:Pgem_evm1s17757